MVQILLGGKGKKRREGRRPGEGRSGGEILSDSTDGCAARLDRTTPDERKKETEVGGRSTVPAGRHVPSFLELRISFYGSQLFWGRRFRPPPFCGKGGTSVPSLLSLLFPNRGVKRFGSLRLPPTGSRKDRIRDRSRRRL